MAQESTDDGAYLGMGSRRRLLVRGAQSLAAIAAGGVLGGRMTEARPIGSMDEISIVEKLTITVVTDSYHHAFEPALRTDAVTVKRTGFFVATGQHPVRTLQSEWGLSLHIESVRADEHRRVLLDFGYTPHTLLNNLEILGIDPSKIDALALSHGHVDHFGGLAGFLYAFKGKLRPHLPLYVGGEECFCERDLVIPGNSGYFGVIDRQSIRDAGLVVTFADRPSVIVDHGFTTGWIELRSFERVLAPTQMILGNSDKSGCDATQVGVQTLAGTARPDDFSHEISVAYKVGSRGLVVMTSCGHRGIINSVRAAMEASGVTKVLAVVGGFHLAPFPREYQMATAKALLDINPEFVIPMHCSGESFIRIINDQMSGRFIRSSTGTSFTFTA